MVTVTVPDIPVPVTTIPTSIVPELPSTTNAVDELIAPFTEAVAVSAVIALLSTLRAATTLPELITLRANIGPDPGTVVVLYFS